MMRRIIFTGLCATLLTSCSSRHYEHSADKEVASIMDRKVRLVPNMDSHFSIADTNPVVLNNYPVFDKSEDAFGADREIERGARVMTLTEALDFAVKHSNDYQKEKESLYISALDLTYARFQYTPIFSGTMGVDDVHQMEEVDKLVKKTDPVTGATTTTKVGETYKDDQYIKSSGSLSASALIRTGGKITTSFTTDFLRFVSGDPRAVGNSALSAQLTQPLLQGAGYTVAMENLTQAERNMLYSLRSFTRYRKDFAVNVASMYYSVLQNRDAVRNNYRGLEGYRQNVARERAYFEVDRKSQASLDQLKQAELQTESDWISSIRTYRQALDRFKLFIGLHAEDKVILDEKELDNLKIIHPTLTVDDAVNVAMVNRLDLDTQRDKLSDAQRHIKVAKNGLLPGLNLNAGVSVDRQSGKLLPEPDWQRYGWNVGLGLDLPLNKISERNNYRISLINADQARRDFTVAVDNIKLQIADDWRNIDEAKRTYEIRELGVQIASRRVEEQRLRQELGSGTSRDLVDAENDLISSKNQRTAALVNHFIARLGFYRDMGVLWIKDSGLWEENADKSLPIKHETTTP
jgi:outer membrane protein TolC